MDNGQKDAIPGVSNLKTKKQYYDTYKWSKDVAGHDGSKQTAPKSTNSDSSSFGPHPVVGGYTDVEIKKAKGAAKGSIKTVTGAGSKEKPDVNKTSPVRKFTEAEAPVVQQQQDPNAPAEDPNAPAEPAPAVQQQQAPVPPAPIDTDKLLDSLPEIVAHAKERKTLDPRYNRKALAQDIADMLGVEANDPTIAKIVKFVGVTEKISEGFKDQVRGGDRASNISPVLGHKSKKHPYDNKLVGEDEELELSNDKITLDSELLSRLMSYAKDEAKTTMEIKDAVNRMLNMGSELTVDDYHSIVSNLDEDAVVETIRKVKGGYRLLSSKGKNLGTFDSKAAAEKHEREVQYFKHAKESVKESVASIRAEFAESKRLDELKSETLKNYKRTSAGDTINRQNIANRSGEKDTKIAKRNAGQERAEQKLQAKEKDVKESFAQFKAGKL